MKTSRTILRRATLVSIALTSVFALGAISTADAAPPGYHGGAVSGHYYGGYHGGYYGGYRGGYGWRGGYWGGAPYIGFGIYPYAYPYSYGYPYAYGYGYPATVIQSDPGPQQYVERNDQGSYSAAPAPQAGGGNYWYHCASPEGYYPYVKQCSNEWTKETPQPPAGAPR